MLSPAATIQALYVTPAAELLDPQGPAACAFDLWGERGLLLLLGAGGCTAAELVESDGAAARVLATRPAGPTHCELRRRHGVPWRLYSARPEHDRDHALAEAAGVQAPYVGPAPDEVEALLRERSGARMLGLSAVVERVLTWRLTRAALTLPELPPRAWAAAMEHLALRREDPERSAELATACYGATRRELERATFLLEAGWKIRG